MTDQISLQDRYAPKNACFGCGPSNAKGLQIKSMVSAEPLATPGPGEDDVEVVATWQPQKHHEAFEGVLAGGIIGTLLDCHCNWTAAYYLMRKAGAETPPCTVTAEYTIQLRRPTPTHAPVQLRAHVVAGSDDRAEVAGTLVADGKVCATCRGVFVAVKEGHPAFHRW